MKVVVPRIVNMSIAKQLHKSGWADRGTPFSECKGGDNAAFSSCTTLWFVLRVIQWAYNSGSICSDYGPSSRIGFQSMSANNPSHECCTINFYKIFYSVRYCSRSTLTSVFPPVRRPCHKLWILNFKPASRVSTFQTSLRCETDIVLDDSGATTRVLPR